MSKISRAILKVYNFIFKKNQIISESNINVLINNHSSVNETKTTDSIVADRRTSLRYWFNLYAGYSYKLKDGKVIKIVKREGNIKIYDKLIKKYPATNVKRKEDIKELQLFFAKNLAYILINSKHFRYETDHHREKHIINNFYVKKFESRFTDIKNPVNNKKYRVYICIANMKSGYSILYSKKYIDYIDKENKKGFFGENPINPCNKNISSSSNNVKRLKYKCIKC